MSEKLSYTPKDMDAEIKKLTSPATTQEKDNSFTKSIKLIFADIPNEFQKVRATKHEVAGDSTHLSSIWYEINIIPDRALGCSQYPSARGNEVCNCVFYSGNDVHKAFTTYVN